MTIKEYATAIAATINNATVHDVEKANGVIYTGIVVKTETNSAPTVYVDAYYEEDLSVEEAREKVLEVLNANKVTTNFDTNIVTDYENVKSMLRARLYNKATKADVYRKAKDFDGLIIIPYIELDENLFGGKASIKVTNDLLTLWGVTEKEVIDTALKNSTKETKLVDMENLMMELMGIGTAREIGKDEAPQMLVVSNKDNMYGAVSILLEKERLQKMYPYGYVVLPSSIHEVIVVPYIPGCESVFNDMVQEVNVSEVKADEILGNKAYVFAA